VAFASRLEVLSVPPDISVAITTLACWISAVFSREAAGTALRVMMTPFVVVVLVVGCALETVGKVCSPVSTHSSVTSE
jgi:hypothetical protein